MQVSIRKTADKRDLTGFTLVEILIALSILVIVVVSSYTVLRGIVDAWLKGETKTSKYKNARVILDMISREVSQAVIYPASDKVYCVGQSDKLFFILPVGRGEDKSDLIEVGYWLRTTDNALVRHYQQEPDYNFQTADSVDKIGENVREIKFSFYDGLSWKDTWDSGDEGEESGKLPQAIKAKLVLSDDKGQGIETFETTIHLPMGE